MWKVLIEIINTFLQNIKRIGIIKKMDNKIEFKTTYTHQ